MLLMTGTETRGSIVARAAVLLAAGLFVLHGAAHAVGVAGVLGLGEQGAENTSTLLAGSAPGSPALYALGAVWILALGLFVAAAAGLVLRRGWWLPVAFAATLVSIAVCFVWYEAAIVGLVLNVFILAGLVVVAVTGAMRARAAS